MIKPTEIQFQTITTAYGVTHRAAVTFDNGKTLEGYEVSPARPHDATTVAGTVLAKNGTAWAVGRTSDGHRLAWKTVRISAVYGKESYRMRSVPGGYKGDYVKRWSRSINGRRIDFVRIAWNGGKDGVTVRAEDPKTNKTIHEFHYAPKSK